MAWLLPIGVDKGDGITPLPFQPQGASGTATFGTPSPDNIFTYSNNNDDNPNLEQQPDAPEIERAEQATFSNTLRGGWQACLSMLGNLGRGTFIEDSQQNVWRILSSKIKSMAGNMGELSVVGESISFDTPPDEWSVDEVDSGINIIKNPRYFPFLNPSTSNPVNGGNDYTTNVGIAPNQATIAQIKAAVIRAIQTYIDSPFQPSSNQINGLIQNNIVNSLNTNSIPTGVSGTAINIAGNAVCQFAVAAAGEIIQKLWKQEDTPYLPVFQISWTRYFFATQYLYCGAVNVSPVGFVPDFFMSPEGSGTTIFDFFASDNPQAFSVDGTDTGTVAISWLRKASKVEFQRTWFRQTETWIASAVGQFDPQIYSGNSRVTQPYDNAGVIGFIPLPNS